eukprot:10052001-Lingulodinium_polyedra.AAC.1
MPTTEVKTFAAPTVLITSQRSETETENWRKSPPHSPFRTNAHPQPCWAVVLEHLHANGRPG